jgi:hypothetical protein
MTVFETIFGVAVFLVILVSLWALYKSIFPSAEQIAKERRFFEERAKRDMEEALARANDDLAQRARIGGL